MSGTETQQGRQRITAPPVRMRQAAPVTSTARSSDTLPVVGPFARLERFNLAQGYAELAEELTDKVAPIMRRQLGCRSLTLLSDETSGEYMFLTYWDSLEDATNYERSADEWRIRDLLAEHLTAVPEIITFQVHDYTAELAASE